MDPPNTKGTAMERAVVIIMAYVEKYMQFCAHACGQEENGEHWCKLHSRASGIHQADHLWELNACELSIGAAKSNDKLSREEDHSQDHRAHYCRGWWRKFVQVC